MDGALPWSGGGAGGEGGLGGIGIVVDGHDVRPRTRCIASAGVSDAPVSSAARKLDSTSIARQRSQFVRPGRPPPSPWAWMRLPGLWRGCAPHVAIMTTATGYLKPVATSAGKLRRNISICSSRVSPNTAFVNCGDEQSTHIILRPVHAARLWPVPLPVQ